MNKKSTLLAIISLFLYSGGFSQVVSFSPNWIETLQVTSSNNFSNESNKVVVNETSGHVYVLTDFTTDLDSSGAVTSFTNHYVAILKYSETGNLIDVIAIDVDSHYVSGYDLKSSFGLEIDSNGNLFIGYSSYNVTTSYDIHLAKYDSDLNLLWHYLFNATTSDLGLDMEVSAGGNVYALIKSNAGGTDRSRIVKAFGNGVSTSALYTFTGTTDIYTNMTIDPVENIYVTGYRVIGSEKIVSTASVSLNGTFRWRRTDNFNNQNGDHFGRHITYGNDGYIYLTGSSQGVQQHGIDVVSMKINPPNGKRIWENFTNYNLADGGYFVSAHEIGVVYVIWKAGTTVFVDLLKSTTGSNGIRMSFAPIPSIPYGSIDDILISDFKVSANNNFYITGTLFATDQNGVPFSTAFIYKIKRSSIRGTLSTEYQYILEGSNSSSFKGVTMALDNARERVYWICDNYQNLVNHNQEIIHVYSLESPGVISFKNEMDVNAFENFVNNRIDAFPNPANTNIHFSSQLDIYAVEIFELTGRKVQSFRFEKPEKLVEIDISKFGLGIYAAVIYAHSGNTQKIKFTKH